MLPITVDIGTYLTIRLAIIWGGQKQLDLPLKWIILVQMNGAFTTSCLGYKVYSII